MRRYLATICFCLFGLSTSTFSETLKPILPDKKFALLSTTRTWLKLVLYEPDNSSSSGYSSAIRSQDFFLSPEGRYEPLSELKATIKAFQKPSNNYADKPDFHPVCRFPARARWLQKKFPELKLIDKSIKCSNFEKWSLGKSTESISIVFVTGYLGNPASFYGHTLLKLNSSNVRGTTPLSDVSVNYGAIIPENENPVSYILKGLMGGYDAGFSHIDYYFHNHNYGETELRDMWEYELNLTAEESQFVIAHAWEVLGKKYTYYFLRKNCAYRMGELLEIIEGLQVTPTNPVYVIPQALIQKVSSSSHNGAPLIRKIRFHPSRQTRFYSRFNDLSSTEKEVTQKIIENSGEVVGSGFSTLTLVSKQRVLDTSLDYYQYLLKKDGTDENQIQLHYEKILSIRYRLPPGKTSVSFYDAENQSPHDGRKPSFLSLKKSHNNDLRDQISLTIRFAYYDQLDGGAGHIGHSTLSMGEFEVKSASEETYLNYFNIFEVQSINSRTTGLPGDSGFAWNLRAGFEQLDSTTTNDLVFKIQGDIGQSIRLNQNSLLIGYIGGGIQENSDQYGEFYLSATIASHANVSDVLKVIVSYESRYYQGGEIDNQEIFSFTGRYKISTNWDARLFFKDDRNKEVGFSIGYYW